MKHKIIEKDGFTVVGMPIKVTMKDPEFQKKIIKLWGDFIPRAGEIKNRKTELFYGLCNTSKGFEGDPCSFETIAGVEINSEEDIPAGMVVQEVPGAKFFVVSHKGKVEKLGETYHAIENKMKNLKLKEDRSKIFFELYDKRFKENSNDSELDIYSPLK